MFEGHALKRAGVVAGVVAIMAGAAVGRGAPAVFAASTAGSAPTRANNSEIAAKHRHEVHLGMLMRQAEATVLGISVQQLEADLHQGGTLQALAAAKGIDEAAFKKAYLAALKAELDGLVGSGRLTGAQADRILDGAARHAVPGWGGSRPAGFRLEVRELMAGAEAKVLGLTPEQLAAALHDGKTVRQLAAAKGLDEAAFKKLYLAALKTELDALVQAGKIKPAQEDGLLDRAARGGIPGWNSHSDRKLGTRSGPPGSAAR